MTASLALSVLRSRWRIPIVAAPLEPGLVVAPVDPHDLLRALLDILDARVAMAVALWLSLLDDIPTAPADWSLPDRRRLAYLADVARCLRLQRGAGEPLWSPVALAGIEPQAWTSPVTLFSSAAPELPASLLGRRWGVQEVVDVADYAHFQHMYLQGLAARPEVA